MECILCFFFMYFLDFFLGVICFFLEVYFNCFYLGFINRRINLFLFNNLFVLFLFLNGNLVGCVILD